jgi:hypothetical protein
VDYFEEKFDEEKWEVVRFPKDLKWTKEVFEVLNKLADERKWAVPTVIMEIVTQRFREGYLKAEDYLAKPKPPVEPEPAEETAVADGVEATIDNKTYSSLEIAGKLGQERPESFSKTTLYRWKQEAKEQGLSDEAMDEYLSGKLSERLPDEKYIPVWNPIRSKIIHWLRVN